MVLLLDGDIISGQRGVAGEGQGVVIAVGEVHVVQGVLRGRVQVVGVLQARHLGGSVVPPQLGGGEEREALRWWCKHCQLHAAVAFFQ